MAGIGWAGWSVASRDPAADDPYYRQLGDNGGAAIQQIRQEHWARNNALAAGAAAWAVTGLLIWTTGRGKRAAAGAMAIFALAGLPGCWRPFEPVDLQVIAPNEEAFLIPLAGDTDKQTSAAPEEFLRRNLVMTKQVRIPQQWVPKGYETLGPNGDWKAAGTLIRVDRSPVTREWTADPNSGTSNKNEAVWVMTSDQVEFSTGWTITARIAERDDAVVFLANYPNGTLASVLDHEVRAKIQSDFGLEVTDLVMDELRKNATPHIIKVVTKVEAFFKTRGITITNLGITGGFIYKDKSIQDMLVRVFNAEQEKNIAIAKTQAQEQQNKQVILEATGKAQAILTERKAIADGIKAVADANAYEITKAKEDLKTYLALKQLEIDAKRTEKWDGRFPAYFLGGGNPNMLLQAPAAPAVSPP